jgi:hypothetical protein
VLQTLRNAGNLIIRFLNQHRLQQNLGRTVINSGTSNPVATKSGTNSGTTKLGTTTTKSETTESEAGLKTIYKTTETSERLDL